MKEAKGNREPRLEGPDQQDRDEADAGGGGGVQAVVFTPVEGGAGRVATQSR